MMTTPIIPLPMRSKVRRLHSLRARRGELFGADLFADPAWDMLLYLALCHDDRIRVSVSALCLAAHTPATTALRYLGAMEQVDLVHRQPDPLDGRRIWITLTDQGIGLVRRWFTYDAAQVMA